MHPIDCDKGPILDRIEKKFDRMDGKLDSIEEKLVSAAVLAEAHRGLSTKVEEIDTRLKKVESGPAKIIGWSISAAIAGLVAYLFSQWGSS